MISDIQTLTIHDTEHEREIEIEVEARVIEGGQIELEVIG